MQMYDELEEELEWIINVFKADSLTISSLELFRFIRKNIPQYALMYRPLLE